MSMMKEKERGKCVTGNPCWQSRVSSTAEPKRNWAPFFCNFFAPEDYSSQAIEPQAIAQVQLATIGLEILTARYALCNATRQPGATPSVNCVSSEWSYMLANAFSHCSFSTRGRYRRRIVGVDGFRSSLIENRSTTILYSFKYRAYF